MKIETLQILVWMELGFFIGMMTIIGLCFLLSDITPQANEGNENFYFTNLPNCLDGDYLYCYVKPNQIKNYVKLYKDNSIAYTEIKNKYFIMRQYEKR